MLIPNRIQGQDLVSLVILLHKPKALRCTLCDLVCQFLLSNSSGGARIIDEGGPNDSKLLITGAKSH